MNLSIIGTRGIPASYSGFETSVEETAIRFAKKNINTTVYCRKNHYLRVQSKYRGINLIHLPSIKTKHFDTISHTFLSVIHCLYNKCNIVHLYGVGNAIFLPILKLSGINTISIVDGADWQRKKWSIFAKIYLKFCRMLSVYLSDHYIVDSRILINDYNKRFNKSPVYIPYGAKICEHFNQEILRNYNLIDGGYIIFIGRFVKEKGIEFLIKNYSKLQTNIKLVIVGGNSVDKHYEKEIISMGNDNIIFTGFLFGSDYESLLKHSLFYVSCSYLEGTSPSLLSAMSINGYALVSDLDENLETLKGTCETFKIGDSIDFTSKLELLIKNKQINRQKTFEVVNKYYNWDKISQKYLDLMKN